MCRGRERRKETEREKERKRRRDRFIYLEIIDRLQCKQIQNTQISINLLEIFLDERCNFNFYVPCSFLQKQEKIGKGGVTKLGVDSIRVADPDPFFRSK